MKTFKYLVIAMLMVSVLQLRGFFVYNACSSDIIVKKPAFEKEMSYSMKPNTFLEFSSVEEFPQYYVTTLKIIVDDKTLNYKNLSPDKGIMVTGAKGFVDYKIISLIPRSACPEWCDAIKREEPARKGHTEKKH